MALTVRFTRSALGDMVEIKEYIRARNPRGAERVGAQIFAAADKLATMPLSYPETAEQGVRVLQLRRHPYRIYYSVEGSEVWVVHVRHTARQPIDLGKLKPR